MTEVPENVCAAYGELPRGWRLEKLKFFAGVRNSNVDKSVSEDEEPVRLCNYTDVYYNDRITADLQFKEGSATEAEIERFQLKRGQVIITKDSEGWDDIGIPALVAEDMPEVLCGYHLSVFQPGPDLDGAFLAWLCRSDPLNDQFKLGANGVTRFGLYPNLRRLLNVSRSGNHLLEAATFQIHLSRCLHGLWCHLRIRRSGMPRPFERTGPHRDQKPLWIYRDRSTFRHQVGSVDA